MKRLHEAALRVGDIILTTATSAVSKAIRMGTRSDISHAMIYVENFSVIDATNQGVQSRNTQRLFLEDDSSIYVLRPREELSADQVLSICNFVRAQVGTQYSTREAMRTAVGGAADWTRKQFCSRLVAQAYASVGFKLVADPNYCSPGDIKNSDFLTEVQDATVTVTEEELAFWQSRVDFPEMMRMAINAILDAARKRNPDIQSLNDLDAHLARHPEDDHYMCQALVDSSYLTLWEVEKDKNPWQYDFELMNERPESPGLETYCRGAVAGEAAGPNRYIINRDGYAHYSQIYGLRYFRLMLSLYETLASLHRIRVNVAREWLEANRELAPVPETVLRPHTPEWFEALKLWDPAQAEMTNTVIEKTGRRDVCSVCGDDPAKDYRLEEAYRPPAGVDTLRLCKDCLEIRRGMGKPYMPLPD